VPNENNFQLDCQPASYWIDPVQMLLANIKGECRRQGILRKIRVGNIDAIPESLIVESLSKEARRLVGRIHPAFMGGEYLPDARDGEVEIARVSLRSTTADVISIRARRNKDRIRYRIVDEYASVIRCRPKTSKEPLTLGELIALIDSAEFGSEDSWGLTRVFRDNNLRYPQTPDELSQRARQLVDFVTVTSVFYPQLEDWYLEEAQEWLQECTRAVTNGPVAG